MLYSNMDAHFQTGAMRLGKDALVLTQTADSRSIAFLSQSLNEGQDVCYNHYLLIIQDFTVSYQNNLFMCDELV